MGTNNFNLNRHANTVVCQSFMYSVDLYNYAPYSRDIHNFALALWRIQCFTT